MAWNKLRRQRNLKEGSGDYQSVAAAFPGHTSDGPFDAKTKQNKKKLKRQVLGKKCNLTKMLSGKPVFLLRASLVAQRLNVPNTMPNSCDLEGSIKEIVQIRIEWKRLVISSRELEMPRKYFMQG